MHIPRSLYISESTAHACPLVQLVSRGFPAVNQMRSMLIALQLCAEVMMGDESKFAPYIALLPSTYSMPMFFKPAAVKKLMYVVVVGGRRRGRRRRRRRRRWWRR